MQKIMLNVCGLMLQHDTPEDFCYLLEKLILLREFVTLAFKEEVGIEIKWQGTGVDEKGIRQKILVK